MKKLLLLGLFSVSLSAWVISSQFSAVLTNHVLPSLLIAVGGSAAALATSKIGVGKHVSQAFSEA
jgi:hypothetical protein